MSYQSKFLRKAIQISIRNINNGGGPFGALVVKDGNVIASGFNKVTSKHDPTAHAEIIAIRKAAKKLQTFDLSGCEIYSSCEPCPMCLAAIYWARLDALYYGNTKDDAKEVGFDDSFIYEEMKLDPAKRKLKSEKYLSDEAFNAFEIWKNTENKTEY